MVKIYLPRNFVDFKPTGNPKFWLYAKWNVRAFLNEWLNETCAQRWHVSSDNSFTWQMFDTWLNDSIDSLLKQSPYDERPYSPYKKCKPYICFDAKQDAVLFKLRW